MQAPEMTAKKHTKSPSCGADSDVTTVLVGVSVRSAAQSLARAGRRCIAVDQFGDQDTRRIADQVFVVRTGDELHEAVSRFAGQPVVCVGDWPGMIDALVDPANSRQTSCTSELLVPVQVWDKASDLALTEAAAARSGLSFPATIAAADAGIFDGKHRDGICRTADLTRYLIKDITRSGGMGVRWLRSSDCNFASSIIVQQAWVAGRAYGASFLADDSGTRLLGICRSLFCRIGDRPFVHSGSVGPVNCFSQAQSDRLLVAAEYVATTSGLRGIFNIDFIVDVSQQIYLLEVNPRWSSSSEIIERSLTDSSISLMETSMQAVAGESVASDGTASLSIESGRHWIKRVVFARQQLSFDFESIAKTANRFGQLCDIPADGLVIEKGHPVATLIAEVIPNASDAQRRDWLNQYAAIVRKIASA